MKAIVLLSGGLDSSLAVKLVLDQGVKLQAVHFRSVFSAREGSAGASEAARAAEQLRVPLSVEDVTGELLRLVKNPRYGHGSGMNPCIDCRIMQLRRARQQMDRSDARFIVTGEVLGQRPMSQRKDAMRLIDRQAGVAGLVVRPLCALALEPSIAEREGWVDRQRFKGFTGRQRTPQMRLAEELGVTDYPSPAGGCRLTEPGFSRRVKDLLASEELTAENVLLLRVGRHFRLAPGAKLVVGRHEEENKQIESLAGKDDYLLQAQSVSGPLSLARGSFDEELLRRAARITARYGKGRDLPEVVVNVSGPACCQFRAAPEIEDELESLRI